MTFIEYLVCVNLAITAWHVYTVKRSFAIVEHRLDEHSEEINTLQKWCRNNQQAINDVDLQLTRHRLGQE